MCIELSHDLLAQRVTTAGCRGVADQLAAEARRCRNEASEAVVPEPPSGDWDRGNPDRWIESATGDVVLHEVMHSAALARRLGAITGVEWEPLAQQGTYSYYSRPGHHLGIHRDIERCDLSVVIVCSIDGDGGGGDLVVYPSRVREPLPALRRDAATGAHRLSVRPGQAAVLFGGIVPHRVHPIIGSRRRTVAPLCFTLRR